jgi:hypothetical protein
MRLKNVVLLIIFLVYAGYYVGISKGYIKKHSIAGQEERERNFIQQVIGAITPLSPEEQRIELREKLEVLKMHFAMAESNLENYENWRVKAIANPPT